jgi:hypothetical protein
MSTTLPNPKPAVPVPPPPYSTAAEISPRVAPEGPVGPLYATKAKFMHSLDDIVEAMVEKHGVNPEWGMARPGIMTAAGARLSQHEFEFLVGNAVGRFSLADVETAVGEHFKLIVDPAVASKATAVITVTPSRSLAGNAVLLAWDSPPENATVISNVGTVKASGTASVLPVTTTTYTLVSSGPAGTCTASATVTIVS